MKKILAMLMSLMLLVGIVPALAEEDATKLYFLEGEIIEFLEENSNFVMDSTEFGHVMVHVNEDTALELSGIEELAVGQYVRVQYNGIMTRSLPGQVNAMKIVSHMLEGTVVSIEREGSAVLVNTTTHGDVIVNLPEGSLEAPTPDTYVVIYYNGIMAMSLPGQIGAWKIDTYARITGTLTEVGEGYYMVEQEDGTIVRVNIGDESQVEGALEAGAAVEVLYSGIMTRSLPPQVFGLIVRTVE